jgi:molecular chaperone Hsp33
MVNTGMAPDDILHAALGDLPMSVLERRPVRFACGCSAQKVARVLVALGRDENERLLREEGRVEVQCRFCGDRYVFGTEQVAAVFAPQA